MNKSVKKDLYYFQKGRCKICKVALENDCYDVDHIIPKCISKNDGISNLQILCLNCHRKKSKHELKKIYDFKKMADTDTPICWICENKVSPYWYVKPCFCGGCKKRLNPSVRTVTFNTT
jgi:uncharacterized CHY-type Zn-finger protein